VGLVEHVHVVKIEGTGQCPARHGRGRLGVLDALHRAVAQTGELPGGGDKLGLAADWSDLTRTDLVPG
jgi:hypothetical protein